MELKPLNHLGDHVPVPALTDDRTEGKRPESLRVPDDAEHPLVQDGNDDLLVLFQSAKNLLLVQNRFADSV